ncbi:MAG: flagellar hook-basal body complex protein FliE [Bryobacteraceae bacterium]|jgi:flagellar hook-basal body complex protein FliE
MTAPISPIAAPLPVELPAASASATAGGGFAGVFAQAVNNVEALNQNASASVASYLNGDGQELHNAVMATNQAELAFDLFLQVRNKVINAYQEVMKMQI